MKGNVLEILNVLMAIMFLIHRHVW